MKSDIVVNINSLQKLEIKNEASILEYFKVVQTDHQMAYNGTEWVDISAGFTYYAGNGINLTNNTFSAVANSAAGIAVDGNGIAAVVDESSIVFDGNGAISAKVKANDVLNVDPTDGLNVAIDGVTVIKNASNALETGDIDFGTW